MEQLKDEFLLFLSKIWIWIALVLIGVIAKFSYDVSIKKKFTFLTFLSTLGIAVFIGYLASAFCVYKGWEREGMIIVPISTIASEKIIEIIIANAHKWLKKWYNPNKEDENK